jgi:transposase
MGTRHGRRQQEQFWIATDALPRAAGHPFYERLNRLFETCEFDKFAESTCKSFYAKSLGRPSLPPGTYFRPLMIG